MTELKHCHGCGQDKPRDEFSRNQSRCKSCRKRANQQLRATVFDRYGDACACCQSTANLGIDHVDGNGRAHRDELFGRGGGRASGYEFYVWLIKSGFPEGFQILCGPCNASKQKGPSCRLDHAAGGLPAHGTWNRYHTGCRCDECMEARRTATKRERERVRARAARPQ